jgi:hypothetical protein
MINVVLPNVAVIDLWAQSAKGDGPAMSQDVVGPLFSWRCASPLSPLF